MHSHWVIQAHQLLVAVYMPAPLIQFYKGYCNKK